MIIFEIPYIQMKLGFLTSLLVTTVIVLTKNWHGRLTLDTHCGVQKFHVAPTPRVGGIAIMTGLFPVYFWASPQLAAVLGPMLLAALPAFIFGLVEDFTKCVGVRERLVATMVSGVIAWYLTGVSITHTGIWGVDNLLAWLPVSVAFTAIAVGGIANAINIIDGFNGLAAGAMLIMLFTIGIISYEVGDVVLWRLCFSLAAVIFGFLVFNFPFGKIFLGDGGAYLLGVLLAWIAILLPARNPTVSVWASVLACGYPVLETGFSIWRRHWREGHHPGQADSLHLHSLIYKRIARRTFPHAGAAFQNSATSPMLWPFAIFLGGIAILWPTDDLKLFAGLLICILLYRLVYLRLTQFRWCFFVRSSREMS